MCSLIRIRNCQYPVTCCNYIVEGFFTSPKLKESPHQIVHKADALRLLLIHKFGGFYLDLDYVVLNDLSHYNNILVGNSKYNNNMNNSLAAYLDVLFNLYLEQTQSQWPTMPSPLLPRTQCLCKHLPLFRKHTTPTAGEQLGHPSSPLWPGTHISKVTILNLNLSKEGCSVYDF